MTQSDFTGSVSDVLQKAARFYENGDLAAAARFCDAILKAAPGHADTLHLRGIVAFKSGHGDEAVALIRRAIAANGDEPSYYNSLGGVLIDRGAYAEAVEALRKSVALAPAYPQALFNLGTACFGLGAAAIGGLLWRPQLGKATLYWGAPAAHALHRQSLTRTAEYDLDADSWCAHQMELIN